MLEVSTLRSPSSSCKADHHHLVVGDYYHHADADADADADAVVFPTSGDCGSFGMVDDDNLQLLDYIDFSSCCDVPFFDADDGDILPDLEVDPTELLAELEFSSTPPPPEPDDHLLVKQQQQPQPAAAVTTTTTVTAAEEKRLLLLEETTTTIVCGVGGDEKAAGTTTADVAAGSKQTTTITKEEEEEEDSCCKSASGHSSSKKKPAAATTGKNNNSHGGGKRKVKVDWTPELHRRFVQAVEQLGIDKAVPSRILEIMGMDCLTRHNIASHLQKYRSHRKHLMAREAEAATWAHKRHLYAAAAAGGGAPPRTDAPHPHAGRPWVVPTTIGFPPPLCRPLHVWGHPPHAAAEAAGGAPTSRTPTPMLPVWPRHLAPPRPLPPWALDPAAFWHHHQYNAARKWGPQAAAVTQGTPCVPVPVPVPPPAAMLPRFPVPGMVPHPMYRPTMVPPPPPPPCSKLAALDLDAHPSKESIDAAIGDVLAKPWLPLPLGLKPPSLHSVMSELHKNGVPTIPPAAAGAATG